MVIVAAVDGVVVSGVAVSAVVVAVINGRRARRRRDERPIITVPRRVAEAADVIGVGGDELVTQAGQVRHQQLRHVRILVDALVDVLDEGRVVQGVGMTRLLGVVVVVRGVMSRLLLRLLMKLLLLLSETRASVVGGRLVGQVVLLRRATQRGRQVVRRRLRDDRLEVGGEAAGDRVRRHVGDVVFAAAIILRRRLGGRVNGGRLKPER